MAQHSYDSAVGVLDGAAAAPPPEALLFQIIAPFVTPRAAFMATDLRIPDLVADGPRTVADLARETNVAADSLYRVLRLLASNGMFTEVAVGVFGKTPLSETFRTFRALHQAVLQLPRAVATGRTGVELATGMRLFERLDRHPDEGALFNRLLAFLTGGECDAVVAATDWTGATTVVDVGGGTGTLLGAILARNPWLSGVLLERPQVVEEARAAIVAQGLGERCAVVEGDFFAAVPAGADVFILSHIVHDWDEHSALRILRNVRAAMKPGARLLVLETVMAQGGGPDPSKLADIVMLLFSGGRERTEDEYGDLLARAGLRLDRVVPLPPTPWGTALIEASADGDPA
jgi:SAM-dependent methyltransferase